MGKRCSRYCLIAVLCLAVGCANLMESEDETRYQTLGISKIQVCETYTDREDKLVERCTLVESDAFSGWEAITRGIVSIITFGFMGN